MCCHYVRQEVFGPETTNRKLTTEIVESRKRLEDELGVAVDGFCWPVRFDLRASAAIRLVHATYDYGLVTDTAPLRKGHDPLNVYRTRFQVSWPLEALDLHTSGIIDVA